MADVRHQGGNNYRIVLTDEEQETVRYEAYIDEIDFIEVMKKLIEKGIRDLVY